MTPPGEGATLEPDRRPIAAFDFDRTLTTEDTLRRFFVDVAGRRGLFAAAVRSVPHLVVGLTSDAARDRGKERLCARLLTGLLATDACLIAARTAQAIIASLLRPDTVAWLRWHQRNGHRVVIVSASFREYVSAVARELGVHEVFATDWEIDPGTGRLTGRLDGPNVRGERKAAVVQALLANDSLQYAYGDSKGDAALLALATKAVWIRKQPLAPPPN